MRVGCGTTLAVLALPHDSTYLKVAKAYGRSHGRAVLFLPTIPAADSRELKMWMLSTDRAELHHFSDETAIDWGYAILSHTWGDEELSFQDVQIIKSQCLTTGTNPRDLMTPKIRQCCMLAESHGYKWVWVDSCCIDRTNSAELYEAINSMFRWYQQAEVCYAFLEDVPWDCVVKASDSAFRRSRWHTRGWTLQELIAPATVMFYSRDWSCLGTKMELAGLLSQITGIWTKVLTREVHFSEAGIAVRMSWAANRKTTRVEDESYSLLGLLGVNMPTFYGEGRRAFQRLQLEVMKHSPDASLFAWGPLIWAHDLPNYLVYKGSQLSPSDSNTQYLLARSPSDFANEARYIPALPIPTPLSQTSMSSKGGAVRFALTNYGVECYFPLIEQRGFTVMVLPSQVAGQYLGLLLERCNAPHQDLSLPLYSTGTLLRRKDGSLVRTRMITLGSDINDLRISGNLTSTTWRHIHIRSFENLTMSSPLSSPATRALDGAYRLPNWLISKFTALGFTLSQPAASMGLPVRLLLRHPGNGEHIFVDLGLCPYASDRARSHWAMVHIRHRETIHVHTVPPLSHDCARHHVEMWKEMAMTYGDKSRALRLSFRPDQLEPSNKAPPLKIHMHLSGTVYDEMLQEANVSIPRR